MGVQTQINRILNEVDTQASLIAQIKTALEGKTVGSGGSSIETCSVEVKKSGSAAIYGYVGTIAPAGTLIPNSKTLSPTSNHASFVVSDVVVGSIFTVWTNMSTVTTDNGLTAIVNNSSMKVWSFYVTVPAGGTGTITLGTAQSGGAGGSG